MDEQKEKEQQELQELYRLIDEGLDDVKNHRTMPVEQMIADLKKEFNL